MHHAQAGKPVPVRCQLKRPLYDFKRVFASGIIYIHGVKYIFSINDLGQDDILRHTEMKIFTFKQEINALIEI